MKSEAFDLMEDLSRTYWWYRARREIICDAVRRTLSEGSRIADFGCGTGEITTALHKLGFQMTAADISDRCLSICSENGLDTLNLNSTWFEPASLDCIMACDVLEHVPDDVGLLTRLREALRPGGCFIATVPAYDALWSGEDYVSKHVRRYTRGRLQRAFKRAGYRTTKCSYFNTLLFPAVAGAIIGKRLFRPRDMYSSDLQPLPKWQNEVLYRVFALERTLLRCVRFPFGASVMVVAHSSEDAPRQPSKSTVESETESCNLVG